MKTLKLKVKPSHYTFLNRAAVEMNIAWNQLIALYYSQAKKPSHFDLNKMTTGWAKIHFNDTMQMSLSELARRIGPAHKLLIESNRKKFARYEREGVPVEKRKYRKEIRYRKSDGSKRSLGWIPFTADCLRKNGKFGLKFNKHSIRVYESHHLEQFKSHKDWRDSCFVQDSVGDWFLCLVVNQITNYKTPTNTAVGLDLGQKTACTTSAGDVLISDYYRKQESKIKLLQKRGHKRQVKRLHRKIARQRNHAFHNFTTQLINNYQEIYIGDLSFDFVKSGHGGKAAYDNAISRIKQQLEYKGQQANRHVVIVNEKYTTQVCSACGCLSGPQGTKGLVVRNWQCSECDTEHDRDVNAAINICHFGMKHHPPSAGTSHESLIHV